MESDLKDSMQDALGGAVKGSGSPASCSDPVNGLLSVPVLIELRNAAIIVQTVPVLSNHVVRICFKHILTDKLATIATHKVKPVNKSMLSRRESMSHTDGTPVQAP